MLKARLDTGQAEAPDAIARVDGTSMNTTVGAAIEHGELLERPAR